MIIVIVNDHDHHCHCNHHDHQEEPVGHHPPPHFLQPNPIDKLYLMQVGDDDVDVDFGDDDQISCRLISY